MTSKAITTVDWQVENTQLYIEWCIQDVLLSLSNYVLAEDDIAEMVFGDLRGCSFTNQRLLNVIAPSGVFLRYSAFANTMRNTAVQIRSMPRQYGIALIELMRHQTRLVSYWVLWGE